LQDTRPDLSPPAVPTAYENTQLVGLYSGGELKSEFYRSTDRELAAEMEPANKHGERIN
jgi:hypothetical protein